MFFVQVSDLYSKQSIEISIEQEDEPITVEMDSTEPLSEEEVEPTEAKKQLNPCGWDLPDPLHAPLTTEHFQIDLEHLDKFESSFAPVECSDGIEDDKFAQAQEKEQMPIRKSRDEQMSDLYSKVNIQIELEEENDLSVQLSSSDEEIEESVEPSEAEKEQQLKNWTVLDSLLKEPISGQDIQFESERVVAEFALDFAPIVCEKRLTEEYLAEAEEMDSISVEEKSEAAEHSCGSDRDSVKLNEFICTVEQELAEEEELRIEEFVETVINVKVEDDIMNEMVSVVVGEAVDEYVQDKLYSISISEEEKQVLIITNYLSHYLL